MQPAIFCYRRLFPLLHRWQMVDKDANVSNFPSGFTQFGMNIATSITVIKAGVEMIPAALCI